MKTRLASFLVKHSKLILILSILIAIAFALLIPQVNVNKDMTKYLAKDSPMKHGLDIMKAEFGDENSSSLKVMFNNLKSQDEKDAILSELEGIKDVDSVDYEAGDEDYNRGEHTLYVVNCADDQYSDAATNIYNTVNEKYAQSHDIDLSGTIYEENVTGLPLWIVGLAVAIIILILVIMANSFIEPLAFLITIGIAVLINMGSYIFFDSIASTTYSIVALLQMVLSIDYSIMLLNRYRQQRAITPDKKVAMVDSLVLSFGAITGSSITTFAGLLALLFMSFTIGADIGLALAKGVVISLLCIFTVLPALLLGFDGLMLKTSKKTIPFTMTKLSGLQYKFRVPLTLLFAGLLVFGFVVKSNVDFSYASIYTSEIEKVFGKETQLVMVYNVKDSEQAGVLADELEDDEDIRSATCYENTIGKIRTAASMKEFIDDMSENTDTTMDLDEEMVKLIYYDYFADSDSVKMTISEFVSFLRSDIIGNDTFEDALDSDSEKKINQMAKYTNRSTLVTKMSAGKLANFFGMKKSDAEQLLLYYMINKSSSDAGKMTLPDFIDFLIYDVASDSTYGKMIDEDNLAQLQAMQIYTDKEQMTTPVDSNTAATMMGMDPAQMQQIFAYYEQLNGGDMTDPSTWLISVQTVVNFIVSDENLRASMSGEQIGQLETLQALINVSVAGSKLSAKQMASALSMKTKDVRSLYLLNKYNNGETGSWKLTPQQFINFLVSDVLSDSSLNKKMKGSAKELKMLRRIINSVVARTSYTSAQLADLFDDYSDEMDADSMSMLYKYYGSINNYDDSWEMNLVTLVHHLDDNIISNKAYSKLIEDDMKADVIDMRQELDDNVELLEGENYGRMIISAKFDADSDETRAYLKDLTAKVDNRFGSDHYFIGTAAMAYEMSQTFKSELNKITLITALFILLIVLATFRRLATPIILVLIIQSAVFLTMGVMSFVNLDMNYLALLIVQSIMMGATIDYAIIYSSYYVECRLIQGPRDALKGAFKGSLQTILTSALILTIAVGILSFAFSEEATRQICRILSVGCFIATASVILLLPAILACFDRFVAPKEKA